MAGNNISTSNTMITIIVMMMVVVVMMVAVEMIIIPFFSNLDRKYELIRGYNSME